MSDHVTKSKQFLVKQALEFRFYSGCSKGITFAYVTGCKQTENFYQMLQQVSCKIQTIRNQQLSTNRMLTMDRTEISENDK